MEKVVYSLWYENTKVDKDFEPLLTSLTYSESLEGRASDLQLSLLNNGGQFFEDWLPKATDKIRLSLGTADQQEDFGQFYIDEVEHSGSRSGDVCEIRAMSLSLSNLENKKVFHRGKSIQDLVNEVATELDLKVEGEIKGKWEGWQNSNGLAFLNQVAKETGHILKLEGDTLVFFPLEKIKTASYKIKLKKSDLIDYRFQDKAEGRFSSCVCKWWDAQNKKQIQGKSTTKNKGAKAVIWQEVQDKSEATDKAKQWLEDKAKKEVNVKLTCVGNVKLRAGVKIELSEFGKLNGDYYIQQATHKVNRSQGYVTEIELGK